jgi:Flp pilus assembly pilin Flp
MKMFNLFKKFKNDESGAVTVDWVVLTAAVVALGGVVGTTISGGVTTAGSGIVTAIGGNAAAPAPAPGS